MKRFLFVCLLSILILHSKATVFTITVSNFQFSPANIQNVLVGDIIQFAWISGSHTTTCDPAAASGTSLPVGAATWDVAMNSSQSTFQYTVTKPGVYNYVCIPHSNSMTGTFKVSASLPVILTSFKVSKLNNTAFLNWQTSTELNSHLFSVKKSTNGSDYREIASIPAAGNSSSVKTYSYVDNLLSSDNSKYIYYQLEMIDKDGKSNFSPAVLFSNSSIDNKIIISATPNPMTQAGHLMIHFNADIDGEMQVSISTLDGKIALQSSLSAHKGVNMGHLHIPKMAAGTYKITYVLGDKIESGLLLIQ